MVANSFHPHVWYGNSEDVFRRNIVCELYQPVRVNKPWGKECDYNLLHSPGMKDAEPATALQQQSGRDANSVVAEADFVNPAVGDYRFGKFLRPCGSGFGIFRWTSSASNGPN